MKADQSKPKRPEGQVPGTLIRNQLETMLANEIFSRSKNLCKLLRFLVDQALEGKADSLTEQVILYELYRRRTEASPETDSVVRGDARRLRSKLRDYYAEAADHQVLISIPKGKYAPEFAFSPVEGNPSALDGSWIAEVTYESQNMVFPRFETSKEVFVFEVEGDQVFGTATFLGAKKVLRVGKVYGTHLTFVTKSRMVTGHSEQEVIRRYDGKLSGEEIRFTLVIEGDSYRDTILEFSASRIDGAQ